MVEIEVGTRSEELPAEELEAPSYEQINAPVIFLVGIISAIATFLVITLVQGMYYHWQREAILSRSWDVVDRPVVEEIDEQRARLEGDPGLGIVSINQGMQDVIKRFGGGPSAGDAKAGEQPAGQAQ